MGRIPSEVALSHRGVNVDSCSCSACIGGLECGNHILVECPYVVSVKEAIWRWCGINQT